MNLVEARTRYREFILSTRDAQGAFRLTPNAEPSAYALCFAIFGLHLLQERALLEQHRDEWDRALRQGLERVRQARAQVAALERDKPYLQLLTFTLSALWLLGTLREAPLESEVVAVLPTDVEGQLRSAGVFDGVPSTGNYAMFIGILLLHAQLYLGRETGPQLQIWIATHLATMNSNGFWGPAAKMSHRQFQNGYHQYELLEYLGVHGAPWAVAAANVAALADQQGHFAPYPGGGGCFDYDAVFMLTSHSIDASAPTGVLLQRTASTLCSEQQPNGGFAESLYIRPRSAGNLLRALRHAAMAPSGARFERLRQGLTLQRPKYDRMHTHWSRYSREWGEANLWDSWFRMLSLARIEVAFDASKASSWGFIDYPGIGYHPSVKRC